jgi:hypothetical protein
MGHQDGERTRGQVCRHAVGPTGQHDGDTRAEYDAGRFRARQALQLLRQQVPGLQIRHHKDVCPTVHGRVEALDPRRLRRDRGIVGERPIQYPAGDLLALRPLAERGRCTRAQLPLDLRVRVGAPRLEGLAMGQGPADGADEAAGGDRRSAPTCGAPGVARATTCVRRRPRATAVLLACSSVEHDVDRARRHAMNAMTQADSCRPCGGHRRAGQLRARVRELCAPWRPSHDTSSGGTDVRHREAP